MVIHIRKEDGKVGDQRTLDQCCAWLPNGDYVVTIETKAQWKKKQPRTLNQNALFHVWCRYIAKALYEYTGDEAWNADLVKKFFAYRFGEGKFTPSGEPYHESVETSKLNKKQMTEYMNKIQAYMLSECGVRVPLPDDDKFKDFQAEYD
jgi:hypothetical protein